MATNKEILAKGVKYLFGALPLMFIGPVILNSSFKNLNSPYFLPIVIIGCLICIASVVLAFIGLKTVTDALFNDK